MPKDKNKENIPPKSNRVPKRESSEVDIDVTPRPAGAQPVLEASNIPAGPIAPTAQLGSPIRIQSALEFFQNMATLPDFNGITRGINSVNDETPPINDPASQLILAMLRPYHSQPADPIPESNLYAPSPVLLPWPQPQPRSPPELRVQSVALPTLQREFSYAQVAPGIQPASTSSSNGGNPLGLWPIQHPPVRQVSRIMRDEPRRLPVINQFNNPDDIWPSQVTTISESGLYNKVCDQPNAIFGIHTFQICQISIAFKMGAQNQTGFRWAILLLPEVEGKRIFVGDTQNIDIIPHHDQFAWLLDPCARMEGGEFLQFLDPSTLMQRRRIHLRPRIDIPCDVPVDIRSLVWKMENWVPQWKDVLCRSVVGVKEPRSLALGTGLWVTAVYQIAYGAPLTNHGPTISGPRNVLGTALESIGSRELGLPFLHPTRGSVQSIQPA